MSRNIPEFSDYLKSSPRVLLLDGAMGSVLRRRRFAEHEIRGERFADHPRPLEGLYDVLSLTQPKVITSVHEKYLAAGADIVATNTFRCSPLDLARFQLEDEAAEICRVSTWLARTAANRYTEHTPDRPRYIAGVIGPTRFRPGETSDDRHRPFDQFVEAYEVVAESLLRGMVDIILIESVYDLNSARAALTALDNVKGSAARNVPVWISFTLANKSTRLMGGETVYEAASAVAEWKPLVTGLNCGADPEHVAQYLTAMFEAGAPNAAFYPSAGLPDNDGEYSYDAEEFANLMARFAERGKVDIVGGCCGTTPAHISALADAVEGAAPRHTRLPSTNT